MDRPDVSRQKVEAVRDLMNAHVPNCLVEGYEELISSLTLPDPNDRHVLAAAIECEADTIVTFNLKDFPAAILEPYGIVARHPDDFVARRIASSPLVVCGAAKQQRESLKNPPMSVDEFLTSLERQGLVQTVASLRLFAEHL